MWLRSSALLYSYNPLYPGLMFRGGQGTRKIKIVFRIDNWQSHCRGLTPTKCIEFFPTHFGSFWHGFWEYKMWYMLYIIYYMMYACVAFCDINRYKWNGLVLTSDQAAWSSYYRAAGSHLTPYIITRHTVRIQGSQYSVPILGGHFKIRPTPGCCLYWCSHSTYSTVQYTRDRNG